MYPSHRFEIKDYILYKEEWHVKIGKLVTPLIKLTINSSISIGEVRLVLVYFGVISYYYPARPSQTLVVNTLFVGKYTRKWLDL